MGEAGARVQLGVAEGCFLGAEPVACQPLEGCLWLGARGRRLARPLLSSPVRGGLSSHTVRGREAGFRGSRGLLSSLDLDLTGCNFVLRCVSVTHVARNLTRYVFTVWENLIQL